MGTYPFGIFHTSMGSTLCIECELKSDLPVASVPSLVMKSYWRHYSIYAIFAFIFVNETESALLSIVYKAIKQDQTVCIRQDVMKESN